MITPSIPIVIINIITSTIRRVKNILNMKIAAVQIFIDNGHDGRFKIAMEQETVFVVEKLDKKKLDEKICFLC